MKKPTGARMGQRRAAFSLIELLSVIAVISILAAILIPTLNVIRARAANSNCASNLRQLGAALILYSIDNDGKIPGPGDLAINQKLTGSNAIMRFMLDYIPLEDDGEHSPLLVCPMSDIFYEGQDNKAHYRRISRLPNYSGGNFDPFGYSSESNPPMQISLIMETTNMSGAEIPMIYDRLLPAGADGVRGCVHNGSRNFLFLDGHVQSLPGLNPLEDKGITTD